MGGNVKKQWFKKKYLHQIYIHIEVLNGENKN